MKHLNIPRNYKAFLVVLSLIAIVAGSLFYFKLSPNNQELLRTSMESYLEFNEYNSFFNVFLFNLILFFLIWLFGLSMFGSFLIVSIYFIKLFLLSISVSSIVALEEKNAILKAIIYVFPSQILNIFIYFLLVIIAINFSFIFYKILFLKQKIDFKEIFKNYNKAFLILFLILIFILLYQCYLNPLIFKLLFK